MTYDFTADQTPETQGQDNTWLEDIGDFFSSVGDGIVDLVMPDVLDDVSDPAVTTDVVPSDGSTADLPNNGFYQSLPGIDSYVGSVLDQNAQLCADIDEFGKETFGEQAWAEAGEVAKTDPYGMLDGIETPSEMYARFHKEDAQANADFEDWRWNETQINNAEDLLWDAETLVRYGY